MRPQPLLQGVLCDGSLDLRNEFATIADPQCGIEPRLDRRMAQLDISQGVTVREVAVGELSERITPPQTQGAGEHIERLARLTLAQRAVTGLDQSLELVQVDGISVDEVQLIAGLTGLQPRWLSGGSLRTGSEAFAQVCEIRTK